MHAIHFLSFLSFFLFVNLAFAQDSFKALHTKVSILSSVRVVGPKKPFQLAIRFQLDPSWHTYWVNPGDSGVAAQIKFSLPEGFQAGEILWPLPQRFMENGLVTYGYQKDFYFIVPVVPSEKVPDKNISIQADIRWLVCHEICVPEEARIFLSLPVSQVQAKENPRWKKIDQWSKKNSPSPVGDKDVSVEGEEESFVLRLPVKNFNNKLKRAEFFPVPRQIIQNEYEQALVAGENFYELVLKKSIHLKDELKQLDGILIVEDNEGKHGYLVHLPVQY